MSRRTTLVALLGAATLAAGCGWGRKHTQDAPAAAIAQRDPAPAAPRAARRAPRVHPPLRNGHFIRDFLRSHGAPDASAMDASNPFPDFWWIGANSTDTSAIPNTGVEFTVQVIEAPPQANGGCLSYWTSDTLDNDMWGQIGFSGCPGEGAYSLTAFFQVWNLAVGNGGEFLVDQESTAITPGLHTFSMYVESGTTWAYAVDGNVFGVYDMGSASGDVKEGVATLCEEGDGLDAAFVPPVVPLPVTMAVRSSNGTTWDAANTAEILNTPNLSGVVGNLQNGALANDQVVIGGDAETLPTGTVLWNGTSTEGGLSTASDAGTSDPPYVLVDCPVAGATLGGTVVVRADATAPLGVAEVDFSVGGTSLCSVTSPPFTCSWDTSGTPDGQYFLLAQAFDTQDDTTWEYVLVNVDHTASSPCSTEIGDGGAEAGDAGPVVSTDASASDAGDAGKADAAPPADASATDAATTDGAPPADAGADAAHSDSGTDAGPAADGAPAGNDAAIADAETGDAASGGSASSGGCGCRTAGADGAGPHGAWAIGLLGLALGLVQRRRRS